MEWFYALPISTLYGILKTTIFMGLVSLAIWFIVYFFLSERAFGDWSKLIPKEEEKKKEKKENFYTVLIIAVITVLAASAMLFVSTLDLLDKKLQEKHVSDLLNITSKIDVASYDYLWSDETAYSNDFIYLVTEHAYGAVLIDVDTGQGAYFELPGEEVLFVFDGSEPATLVFNPDSESVEIHLKKENSHGVIGERLLNQGLSLSRDFAMNIDTCPSETLREFHHLYFGW